jgi:phage terminase large subunit-like protein
MVQHGPAWLFDGSDIPDPRGYADRALRFLGILKHPKSRAENRALIFDEWQQRIIRKIYGPCHDDGRRICRVVYLQVGRGNRKTSLGAALEILHTFGPERIAGGQSLSAAADRKQARIAFDEADSIIKATPELAFAARVQDFKNRIVHPKSGAVYEAISADAATQYGRTPNFALVDELWAHKKAALWHAIKTGLVKVSGSLLVITTTAGRGSNTPDFPIYEYAKKVASGEIEDPSFLPIIFEAPKDCDWQDEEIWQAVNPGLKHGYPDLDGLRQSAREARERPADREAFQQFHLGIRQEHSVSPFVDIDIYDEGNVPVDLKLLAGRRCWIAADLSSTTDLSAVVAAWPDDDEGFDVAAWFFVPRENIAARSERDQVPYERWEAEGHITFTDGNAIDYRVIEAKIRELHEIFDVQEDCFDRAYAQPVMAPLLDDGFPVITLQQGWVTQSPALNVVERAIVSRRFRHGGHPVLRWCFENVVIHTDSAGNRVMHKGKSRGRIDGAAATWMAVSRAAAGDTNATIYSNVEERPTGLIYI